MGEEVPAALRRAALVTMVATSLLAANAHADSGKEPSRRFAIPGSTAWHRYVEAPFSAVVRPVKVVSVIGDVSNAGALVPGHSGDTTLTYPSGGTEPVLVLDYGNEVGGYVHFTVQSVSGSPTLRSIRTTASACERARAACSTCPWSGFRRQPASRRPGPSPGPDREHGFRRRAS